MKVIFIKISLLLGILSSWSYANENFYDYQDEWNVYFPPAFTLPKKNYELTFAVDGFNSTALYNSDSEEVGFEGSEDYSRTQFEVMFSQGFSERAEFRLMARGRRNNSQTRLGETAEAEGLESIGFGLKFRLVGGLKNMLSVDAQIRSFLKDPVDTTNSANRVDLSEEGYELRIGPQFSSRLGRNWFFNLAGWFVRPGSNISDYTAYDASLVYKRPRAALGAGVDGIVSFHNDPADDSVNRVERFPGSTQTIFGFNPYYVMPYGQVWFSFNENFKGTIKAGQVYQGRNWDKYTYGLVSLTYQKRKFNPEKVFEESFKEYDVEATITKVSPRKVFIQMDKGLTDDVSKGMRIDVFEFNYLGGNKLIASGFVFEVGVDTSIVKITKYFNDRIKVKVGHIIRGKR